MDEQNHHEQISGVSIMPLLGFLALVRMNPMQNDGTLSEAQSKRFMTLTNIPKTFVSWIQHYRGEYSAPIVDEQIAADFERNYPELFELAEVVSKGWSLILAKLGRLMMQLRRQISAKRSVRQASPLPPQAHICNYPKHTNDKSIIPITDSYQTSPIIYAAKPYYATAPEPSPIKGLLECPNAIGECERTACGIKFQFLSDACNNYKTNLRKNNDCTVGWSGDYALPYEVILSRKRLLREMISQRETIH
jgi:hypothetical protein